MRKEPGSVYDKWSISVVIWDRYKMNNTFLSALIGGYSLRREIQILPKYGTYSKGLSGADTFYPSGGFERSLPFLHVLVGFILSNYMSSYM